MGKFLKSVDWGFVGFLSTMALGIAMFVFFFWAVTQPIITMVAK